MKANQETINRVGNLIGGLFNDDRQGHNVARLLDGEGLLVPSDVDAQPGWRGMTQVGDVTVEEYAGRKIVHLAFFGSDERLSIGMDEVVARQLVDTIQEALGRLD